MKKTWLFAFSILVAFGITFYTKNHRAKNLSAVNTDWKTYVKTSSSEISAHHTTHDEYLQAKILNPQEEEKKQDSSRSPSSISPFKGYMVRDNRVLMGEVNSKYEDSSQELPMSNKINPKWKDEMGHGLMRFQDENTKLLVKEELPIIRIQNGTGRFLEQVVVTYLMENGEQNSFKALVDSDTGMVIETWDRTIHEKLIHRRGGITLPSENESGIVAR